MQFPEKLGIFQVIARYKFGETGNPKGRPKGPNDKRTELRELLRPDAPELIEN